MNLSFPLQPQSRHIAKLFFSRPNSDSPTPSPADECSPPPFGWGCTVYTIACGRGVGGGGGFRWGNRHCCALGTYRCTVLCDSSIQCCGSASRCGFGSDCFIFYFDADPEPIWIRIWILPQILQMLENLKFLLTFIIHSARLQNLTLFMTWRKYFLCHVWT